MAQAVNQHIAPGNQQPIINAQQQILQNEDCIQLPRAAMGIVIILCGVLLLVHPLTTPDHCQIYYIGCWGIINAAIAVITGCVGVFSGMKNNKYVNIGFRILALFALHMSGIACMRQVVFAMSVVQDASSYVLVGILACECIACIIGLSLTCINVTSCCVKQSDRVDVNRPDVVPPANEEVVNPANQPATKAPTKAPKHRPPTKAITLPDMFYTA
ncbi:uncharacterized protein [Apostichopus japonicus]|uniref:uncharacterized protein isoform X1 n=1 Tax=Stichopus japonicus TaxID=307972 RepID=UPI003AB35FDF